MSNNKPCFAKLKCTFCNINGHIQADCYKFLAAQKEAKSRTSSRKKSKVNANIAQAPRSTPSAPSQPFQTSDVNTAAEEVAGHASLPPSHPTSNGSDWVADTGATSHMTPNRHWFTTYSPFRTPVRLANGSIVYSAGIGSVRFQPIIHGRKGRLLEFYRVLHVPGLRSNLLAVLYLSKHKGYTITINNTSIKFSQSGTLLFTATINSRNAAFLDGEVVFEVAGVASTCPMDLALWHRRLGHLHIDAVQKLAKQELVTGLHLQSNTTPDPICEPCIAGKQHRSRVPKSAQHRASQPLELIHSDLHGPLPVHSKEGYQYWVTFIDDCSRFFVVAPLKKKSDTFAAFQCFKALAENQLDRKIKMLRDDKGGEYMSDAFDTFLASHGIARHHTNRNEPHQNGVAERANRTLAEGITAMLEESSLPPSFWNFALSTFVHVHNRSPTYALANGTPYEHWFKSKPDLAHLRVFGCLSYVNVQKDQRKGLQSHTRKCIFVGYPPEHKGWLFYDWTTKRTLVSDAAIFDERVFPGRHTAPLPSFLPLAPSYHPSADASDDDSEEPEEPVGETQHVHAPHTPQLSGDMEHRKEYFQTREIDNPEISRRLEYSLARPEGMVDTPDTLQLPVSEGLDLDDSQETQRRMEYSTTRQSDPVHSSDTPRVLLEDLDTNDNQHSHRGPEYSSTCQKDLVPSVIQHSVANILLPTFVVNPFILSLTSQLLTNDQTLAHDTPLELVDQLKNIGIHLFH